MKRKFIAVYLIALLFLFVGCAGMQISNQPVTEMTPKQKASMMMGMYNVQYDDYLLKVAILNLTEEEKTILLAKKKLLTEVYPLIQSYDMIQAAGGAITQEAEDNIFSFLNNLETLIIRR